jgi:hypothetical protein
MAESNWEARDIFSLGPKYRIDVSNPQVGADGPDVYNMYGVNDNKDVALIGLSEGGTYRIYNERTIEMVAGIKNKETGIDILISGKNGDISILAERNGRVRIKAHNIMIEADEDIDMVAGRNISLKSGSGRILLEGNKCDAKGLTGNLIEDSFGVNVFDGSFVGFDVISSAFSLGTSLLGGGGLGSILGGGLLGDLAGGLTGGLTGGLGGIVGGLTGGLTSGLGGIVGDLAGGLTGGLGGIAGDLAGGLTSGLTGGLGGIAGDLAGGLTSGLTGSLGDVGSSLISGGINSATSSLSSGLLGNLGDIEETVNLIRSVSGR